MSKQNKENMACHLAKISLAARSFASFSRTPFKDEQSVLKVFIICTWNLRMALRAAKTSFSGVFALRLIPYAGSFTVEAGGLMELIRSTTEMEPSLESKSYHPRYH